MKLSYSQIRDYADAPLTPQEFEKRLIMTGTAVEGVEDLGAEIERVVVGRVLSVEPLEGSDHLHICQVDAGEGEPLQIVCGAPNVAAGLLVPVALDGAKLPDGVRIKKGKLRGVESAGMLCSATELRVPQELYPSIGDAGLLVFREEYPIGADVRPILGIDQTAVDFDILANRPDCLCALGIARETAAVCGVPFQAPAVAFKEAPDTSIRDHVKVSVLDTALCPRYAARVIQNVRIAPSPLWLRKYLHAAGLRAINNIVDITNFVMLETGHPMHAFDLAKVRGAEIVVRRAAAGETLVTLDEKERVLSENDLLICDAEGATGLAGVMGGAESEITAETRTVMFECAVFDRTAIRLTSRALGLRTESSGRFEKGVSEYSIPDALHRACHLVEELDAGDIVSGEIDLWVGEKPQTVLTASVKRIANRAGVDIPAEDMVNILRGLFFEVTRDGDTLTVTVPRFRLDVEGEADLCEEVLRVYGYDHIASTRLRGETTQGGLSLGMARSRRVARALIGQGFLEIMNYSFISLRAIEKLRLNADDPRMSPLAIRNPLGEDTAVMRPTLAPDMLRTLSYNMNHGNDAARLYEIAATFDPHHPTAEGLPTEKPTLCLGAYGEGEDFYALRGAVELLLTRFGVRAVAEAGGENYHHPGRRARLMVGPRLVATVGEVHPDVLADFDMKKRALIAEVDLSMLYLLSKPMGDVAPLPRFPAMSRDLAMVIPEETLVGPMTREMSRAAGQLLEDIRLFDVYRGVQVGVGRKSAAFTLVFRAQDRTLTDAEVQKAMDKVIAVCEKKFGAAIRA